MPEQNALTHFPENPDDELKRLRERVAKQIRNASALLRLVWVAPCFPSRRVVRSKPNSVPVFSPVGSDQSPDQSIVTSPSPRGHDLLVRIIVARNTSRSTTRSSATDVT